MKENDRLEITNKIEVDNIKQLLSEKMSYIPDIGSYGICYQLKCYAGIDVNAILNKCTIEHGLAIYKYVCQIEVQHHVSRILTYSPFREKVIRELTELIPVAIGPYIAYAEDYQSNETIEKKKNETGRVLLVMPNHSIREIKSMYNCDSFIREIERVKKKFDTVMVCLYFEDLKSGMWKPYKEKGYHIVSAGFPGSPHFFSRLKYILSLSDAMILNEYSTGMAYAMYMGKPVHLIRQKIEHIATGCNNCYQLENRQCDEIYELFYNDQFVITEKQIEFGKYMFGLDCVKSAEEMKKLLLSLIRITR